MITEVFVDMDGVISDFRSRFKQLYQKDPLVDYPRNEENDYRSNFDKFVREQEFINLDPMPDLEQGLKFLREVRKQCLVSILTSSAREEYLEELVYQKKTWLKTQGIEFHPILVPGKHLKHYYSKPGRVLIDDTLSTIENWRSMGGIGIHHKSWTETIKEYKEHEKSIRRNKS